MKQLITFTSHKQTAVLQLLLGGIISFAWKWILALTNYQFYDFQHSLYLETVFVISLLGLLLLLLGLANIVGSGINPSHNHELRINRYIYYLFIISLFVYSIKTVLTPKYTTCQGSYVKSLPCIGFNYGSNQHYCFGIQECNYVPDALPVPSPY